jgi:hypothetical protein
VMTTTDQQTTRRGPEPRRTLARLPAWIQRFDAPSSGTT